MVLCSLHRSLLWLQVAACGEIAALFGCCQHEYLYCLANRRFACLTVLVPSTFERVKNKKLVGSEVILKITCTIVCVPSTLKTRKIVRASRATFPSRLHPYDHFAESLQRCRNPK